MRQSKAIEDICRELDKALDKHEVDSLLLVPIFIHDFLLYTSI